MKNKSIAVYLLFVCITIRWMVFGKVTFISTLILYSFILLLLVFLVNQLFKVTSFRGKEVKLLLLSIVITLCITDLALRYVVKPKTYLTYLERNGAGYYYSPTLMQKFYFINRYFVPKYKRGWGSFNKPDVTKERNSTEFSYAHQYNHEGLRNSNVPDAKRNNEIRVLAMGDSFTEGVGAPQDSTWPFLLNRMLNTGKDSIYTVINAGISSFDPFFELYLLKYKLLKYKPDVVLVAVNTTDIDEVLQRGGYERFQKDSTLTIKDSPCWEPVFGASILFRMIMMNVFHYNHQFIKLENQKQTKDEARRKLIEPLESFIKLSQMNRFKLVFIFHPMQHEIQDNKFDLTEICERMQKHKDVTVINLFDDYKAFLNSSEFKASQYYWATDLHHNSKGYHLWSKIVFDQLKDKKLLPL